MTQSSTTELSNTDTDLGGADDPLPISIKTVAAVLLSLLIVVTVVGNVWVMLAVLARSHLRGTVANIFILNLCLVDLIAGAVAMPLSLITLAEGSSALSSKTCEVSAFCSTVAMITSGLSLSAIASERLYSIALPMHQAGHASLGLYLLLGTVLWGAGVLLSCMPWFGIGSYKYSPTQRQCSLAWYANNRSDQAFSVVLLILSFILPTLVLVTMYIGVFRVAKKAACTVAPQPTITVISTGVQNHSSDTNQRYKASKIPQRMSVRLETKVIHEQVRMRPMINVQHATPTGSCVCMARQSAPHRSLSCSSTSDEIEDSGIKSGSVVSVSINDRPSVGQTRVHGVEATVNETYFCLNFRKYLLGMLCKNTIQPSSDHVVQPIQQEDPNRQILRENVEQRPPQQINPGDVHKTRTSHMKALKTLMVIVLSHVLLWGPFSLCQLYLACTRHHLPLPLDVAMTWLSYCSYAINPCLYGCLNRGIREELLRHISKIQDLCCCYLLPSKPGSSIRQCKLRVPCQAKKSDEESCEDGEDGARGEESFFQFLQRTQGDEE